MAAIPDSIAFDMSLVARSCHKNMIKKEKNQHKEKN